MKPLQERQDLVNLNPELKSDIARDFESKLGSLVIGQDQAISGIASLYQVFHAGMSDPNRPVGTMLFLGPTGSGKTHAVEATAEILFGDRNRLIRIDCAEFQERHEIAKLIGSPPGYLGHRETAPLLTQERLDGLRTIRDPFTIVLFDEIEKASEALWQLLLGILDKATLTLGDNRRVDFSQAMIFMTSNLGAKEISELMLGSIGFAPPRGSSLDQTTLSRKISSTAVEAARKNFSPEFMNRIDKMVVFHDLGQDELRQVLDLELDKVRRRVEEGSVDCFNFILTENAREFLLNQGIDKTYGARPLKRALERFLVVPLANLSSTRQARLGDLIVIDLNDSTQRLAFYRDEAERSVAVATLASIKKKQSKRIWFRAAQPATACRA
jgi:ATP-dependent Clp protease ATP-binding subunit ClpA